MGVTNANTARRPLVTSSRKDGGLISAYTAQLITSGGASSSPINITAPLPENYQLKLSTNFDNPFNSPLSNLVSGKTGSAASALEPAATAATGFSTRTKWLSSSVWQGGNMFQLVIPFVIVAQRDAAVEVVKIMRDLLKLVAPSEENGMLRAPGPNLSNVYSGGSDEGNTGEIITIRLGDFFTMTPCVIDDVSCDFDTQMEANSKCPMSVTITVSALSYQTTTRQDLDKFFQNKVPASS